ncbi:MAG: hypothetical protein ACK4VI_05360 [Alphaproteobacteria bacterium]
MSESDNAKDKKSASGKNAAKSGGNSALLNRLKYGTTFMTGGHLLPQGHVHGDNCGCGHGHDDDDEDGHHHH